MAVASKQTSPSRETPDRPASSRGGRALQPPRYGVGLIDEGQLVQCSRARSPLDEDPERVRALARSGVTGPGEPLPHGERIQQSFGRYDVSNIVAHTGAPARAAARSIGAQAFATGNHVAFAQRPSLRLAAHEAAHVVQQRSAVALAGGVGRSGDVYERHADAVAEQVVKGESAEATLASLAPSFAGPSFAGGGEGGLVQRSAALDVLGAAAGNFAWSYMKQLLVEHAIPVALGKLLEKACLGLIDYGVRVTGVDAYLAAINPYLATLNSILAVIEAIPEPIRVLLTYGIGWCIRKFSDAYMFGAITEAHINTLLIEGGTVVGVITKVVRFLTELATDTTKTIYKGIWAVVRAAGLTTASSFSQLLSAQVSKTPVPAPTQQDPSAQQPAKPKPMVDAKLGWFWLEAHQPEIARWEQSSVERGGLQLDARIGLKVLGNVIGTEEFTRLRVPYAGDWQAILPPLSVVSESISLGGIFKAGPITLQKVRLDHNGVKFVHLVVGKLAFGDDLLTASDLTLTYRADAPSDMLHLRGAATLKAFQHTIAGRFDVQIDAKGEFAGGGVELEVPETFTLVEDRLQLANPKLWAKWAADGSTDIGVGGDLELELIDSLEFASTGTVLRYQTGKGLVGEVERVWLNIPIHKGGVLRFELTKGTIDAKGFRAGKVALIYAYGDEDAAKNPDASKPSGTSLPDSGSKLNEQQVGDLIPGFDMSWIKATGLEMLVVNLSATDVDISSAGLDVGQLSKEVTKFKARLFGVGAEFDAAKRSGSITGEIAKTIAGPGIDVPVPIFPPAVHASFALRTDFGFSAALAATLQRLDPDVSKPEIHPWKLGGKATLGAKAGVQINVGVGVGIPYLAELVGSVFARAEAEGKLEADVAGLVLWNDADHSLALPSVAKDKPSATLDLTLGLKAAIGAELRARLFYFVKADLWSMRFVEWNLGDYNINAKLFANPEGGYEFVVVKSGFGGTDGAPKTKPIIEEARVSATSVIEQHIRDRKKIDDVHMMWRLVHDIQDPGFVMDKEDKSGYFAMLEQINDTGQDLDAMTMQVLGYVRQRSDEDSLLMSHAEWLAYSTTGKTFGDAVTDRKAIKPIDEAIEEYHSSPTNEEGRKILTRLIEVLIPAYQEKWFVSRKDMAAKLLTDAKRELARIS